MEHSARHFTVIALAGLVAVLVLACAYFSDNRRTDIDELALYNPAYMVAHYGRSTYPAENWFDLPMIVHPPVHSGTIGLLSGLGLTWYYAAGTPTACFLLLAIWTVARGNFPANVKLALLFSIGLLMCHGEKFAAFFGSRPEGTLHCAWFAALLLLESARRSNWNRARLFGGAFLLTWAAGMHYYAIPALAGVAVYLVWVVIDLGRKVAARSVLALLGGAMLFGLPYLAFYVVPNWSNIQRVITYHQAGADLTLASLSPIRQHFDLYRLWSTAGYVPVLLRWALAAGVPLMLFSTAVLASVRATRGLAFASLPLQLGIFFFASHKPGVYLIHEIAIFGVALSVGVMALLDWLASHPQLPPWCRNTIVPVAAVLLCAYLVAAGPLSSATLSAKVHPADVARAAARQILGPHARVVSRPGSWYASGAASWHDYHHDLIGPASSDYDPVLYLRNFDAAVDSPFRSGFIDNQERKSLSSWYAGGMLKLRGAYFDANDGELRQVFLSLLKPEKLIAFATRHGALLRFEESPSGDQEVISATCPSLPEFVNGGFEQRFPEASIVVLQLPPPSHDVVVTVLSRSADPEPAGLLKKSCAEIGRVRGRLYPVDRDALIASLRMEDRPIHFYNYVEDVPGFKGVGIPAAALVPEHSVPLPGVVNLPEVDVGHATAALERVPRVIVTTPPEMGAFGAHFPIHGAEILDFPRWVRLRLNVLSGRVSLLVTNPDGAILGRPILLLPADQPLDVAIRTPFGASDVAVANAKDRSPSKVEVLEAVAVASPEDGAKYRRLLDRGDTSMLLGVPPSLQPPAGALRLDGALNLSEAQAASEKSRIERVPQLRVTTPPARGNFAASMPLHLPDKHAGGGWVQLRLKVLSGRVGFAVLGGKGEILTRTAGFLLPTAQPVDVALKVPALNGAASVIVFNENLASASRVEILDAGVLVSPATSAPIQ